MKISVKVLLSREEERKFDWLLRARYANGSRKTSMASLIKAAALEAARSEATAILKREADMESKPKEAPEEAEKAE